MLSLITAFLAIFGGFPQKSSGCILYRKKMQPSFRFDDYLISLTLGSSNILWNILKLKELTLELTLVFPAAVDSMLQPLAAANASLAPGHENDTIWNISKWHKVKLY